MLRKFLCILEKLISIKFHFCLITNFYYKGKNWDVDGRSGSERFMGCESL